MSDTPNKPPSDHDDLERLRAILIGERLDEIVALHHRVDDTGSRSEDVTEVLPAALERAIADPATRPRIEKPIVDTIRGAIRRDTKSFAEALFPVLGPAIRRAVAYALQSLVQRINAAIEQSFTVRGLRWRLEAARSGVPFGHIVLRETMQYVVQEVFLIQPRSGLVMAKARRMDTLALDEDAFSALLTAMQSFIQDSLGMTDGDRLRGVELGDRTLWLINGPQAVMACLVLGSPPLEVREQLMATLEDVHARFGDELDLPPERLSDRPGIESMLEETLLGEAAETDRRPLRAMILWGTAGILLLSALGWMAWENWQAHQRQESIVRLFEAEPGYVVTGRRTEGEEFLLSGLRDPLARAPQAVLSDAGYGTDGLGLAFRPYQSLDPGIVLGRIQRSLAGRNVELQLDGTTLMVRGWLASGDRTMLERLPGLNPAISSVDLSQTRLDPEAAAALARRQLGAPDSVTISPAADRLVVAGNDAGWYATASRTNSVGGWPLDFSPMRGSLDDDLRARIELVKSHTLLFSRRFELADESRAELAELASELVALQELATLMGESITVRLEGHADGVGQPERNREIAQGRAEAIKEALSRSGVDPSSIVTTAAGWESGERDSNLRKVVVQVSRQAAS